MKIELTEVRNVLTRTSGYLKTVSSHSLQPYRGCSFGHALCGVGCYVRHNGHILRGRTWGEFLEVRTNSAQSYRDHFTREQRWARNKLGQFGIFLSSSTEPFLPQEFRYGITRQVLECMLELPPDFLILQSHSHRVVEYLDLLRSLSSRCALRVHLSIETDRENLAGLPGHASSVAARFAAAETIQAAGVRTVVTVSPLLPIQDPDAFFKRIASVADAVVLDHFIEGDGSPDGGRTRRTPLPAVMETLDPNSTTLDYRDAMVRVAERYLPGRVGVSIDGFAGRIE